MENTTPSATERHYKAFISYRHKPLDMEIAKKLHSRIERYVIPADLRKNGEKKLGLVFRDQEELPIANNLTDNITTALDHSEYLIVVCSPDTPGSLWVQREIIHFLEHHDRDHVLAILIDGTPEESFPPQLTEVRNENGELTDQIEPLAANIVSDSPAKRNRLFKTESLRLLASLIGCPYDALYRREQRYKMRRLTVAAAAAALILSSFIGVLLNRNAKISEQLRATKINESRTLAALSESAYRDGDYRGALENSISALPSPEDDRPYVAGAEYALANQLYLYTRGDIMRYVQSFEQDTEIRAAALSPDTTMLVVADRYEKLTFYDISSGLPVWEAQCDGYVASLSFPSNDAVLAAANAKTVCFSSADGNVLWEDDSGRFAISETSGTCLIIAQDGSGILIRDRKINTGEVLYELAADGLSYYGVQAAALSPDGCFAAVLHKPTGEDKARLHVFELRTGKRMLVAYDLFYNTIAMKYVLSFSDTNELIVTCSGDDAYFENTPEWEGAFVTLYDPAKNWSARFTAHPDFGEAVRASHGLVDSSGYPDLVASCDTAIAVASRNRLVMLEKDTGDIRWSKDLPAYVKAGEMYENGSLSLVLSNGLVTLVLGSDGTFSYDVLMGYFKCDYDVYIASAEGSRYRASRFVVIPDSYPTRAAVISFCRGDELEPFPYADDLPDDLRLYPSPSGTALAGIRYDSDTGTREAWLIDPSGVHEPCSVVLEDLTVTEAEQDHIFVTDEGKILIGSRVVDPAAGTVTGLSPDGAVPARQWWMTESSCIARSGAFVAVADDAPSASGSSSCVLTASVYPDEDGFSLYLWEDMNLIRHFPLPAIELDAHDVYAPVCRAVGACGYALISRKEIGGDRFANLVCSLKDGVFRPAAYLSTVSEESLALADAHPWMALQKENGGLCLIDLASGEDLLEYDSSLPASGVTKLLFACEDKWLLAFTNGGDVAIFNTADGKQLHRSSFSYQNLRFSEDAWYSTQFVPEQDRLLILYDNTTYREAVCLSIDTETFERNGMYNGFSPYLAGLGKAVINPYDDKLYFSPLFSREEIRQMGEDLLANGLPPVE